MSAIAVLDAQLKAVNSKVQGVSIGTWTDKATWRVNAPEATEAELAVLHTVLANFDKASVDETPDATPAALLDAKLEVLTLRVQEIEGIVLGLMETPK